MDDLARLFANEVTSRSIPEAKARFERFADHRRIELFGGAQFFLITASCGREETIGPRRDRARLVASVPIADGELSGGVTVFAMPITPMLETSGRI